MDRQEEMREYIIENREGIDVFKDQFPQIEFYPITTKITSIRVPAGAEAEFEKLRETVDSVFTPLVLGLNIEAALDKSKISQFHTYPFGEVRGKDVLIGFIDTGIDYANPLFQYEDKTTRIVSLWDQTIDGMSPEIYSYGSEYTKEKINIALLTPDPYTIVPSRDEIGHGTFLAGVAAGYDRSGEGTYKGAAPDAELVVVKLKPASQYLRDYYLLEKGAIAYPANHFMQGINYLLDVAQRSNKPMAICVGLGDNHGAHNGSTIVERFLEEVSSIYNVIVVSSAGNEANKGHHYSNIIKEGEVQAFEVNVGEGERGFILQLWATGSDKIAMGITSPLGKKVPKVPLQVVGIQEFTFPLEKVKISFTYQLPNINTGSQMIQVRIADPTPGLWTFTVYGDLIVDGPYNVWLPREGYITEDTRFLKADPFITVCILSTGKDVIVVGAYNAINDSIYPASGRGPTTNQVIKPDIIAPGVDIIGPTPGGGFTTYTGTSVAAAITAGACALLLEWGIIKGNVTSINTRIARTILMRGARRTIGVKYPNPSDGYGKLDLKNSIDLI